MLIARARRARVGIPLPFAAFLCVVTPGMSLATQANPVAAPLEEIIVTARKKPEDPLDIPLSLQVLAGTLIEVANKSSLLELQFEVPGLVITNAGMNGGSLSLRGVTNQGGGDLAVAAHQDGVPFGNARLAMTRVFDVERIEVLKGPQGTLYGRNSTGGSINVINRGPGDSPAGSVEIGVGSFGLQRADAHIDIPLGSSAVRLAVAAADSDGYVRNSVDDRRFAAEGFIAGRVVWRARPTDAFSIDMRVQHVDDDGGLGELWMPRPDYLPDPGDPYLTTVTHPNPFLHLVSDSASLALEYDFGGGSLYSLTGYAQNRTDNIDDCAGVPRLTGCVRTALPNTYEQWSQELRLQSLTGSRLEWLVGLYFLDGDDATNYYLRVPAFGLTPRNDRYTGSRDRSLAAFGQATWVLDDAWRLTAGARFGRDRNDLMTVGTGVLDNPVPAYGTGTWDGTAWKLGIDRSIGDLALLYASIATGYKSGGFVPEVLPDGEVDRYAPERVTAYEAGVNISEASGRASLRAAAFYYDFTDLQVSTTILVNGDFTTDTDNASRARVYGLDLTSTVAAGENWSFSAGTVWLPERSYVEFITVDNNEDVSGNFLNRAPEWSATAAIEYQRALWRGKLSARLDGSYRSLIYFTRGNLPEESQDAFTIANLYLRYEASSQRWYLYASGKNLTDETYFTQVFLQSAVGMPRTWEAGFGLRY